MPAEEQFAFPRRDDLVNLPVPRPEMLAIQHGAERAFTVPQPDLSVTQLEDTMFPGDIVRPGIVQHQRPGGDTVTGSLLRNPADPKGEQAHRDSNRRDLDRQIIIRRQGFDGDLES